MSTREEMQAAAMMGPEPGTAADGSPRIPQRITGSGTTEDHNDYALSIGQMATMLVGAVAIRFRLAGSAGLSTQVAATDPYLPAGARFDWLVDIDTCFVYQEADGGSGTHESHVWTSSK